ncbi:MAG: Hint domain-containing protein [Pseudomonadota bacterium]
MAIGEAGSLTRGGFATGEIVRIDFEEPIENAVVHLSSTNFGGNEFSLRVVSIDDNGFSFILEEWEDEDGPHPATEQINWIAIEEGVHVLPDGRIIEAGTTTATTSASSVSLQGGFTNTPAVLTNVLSNNETDVVDSDPLNVTSGGFDVRLQEGSLVDGVNNGETVGYIAIGVGGAGESGYATVQDGLVSGNTNFALGGSLTNGVIFAETQTVRETDAGNVAIANNASADGTTGTIRLRFDEETGDGESAHGDEIVGIVGFEDGLILCLTADAMVDTSRGPRPAGQIQTGDKVICAENGPQPVLRVFKRKIGLAEMATDERLRPVCIEAGALGLGLPRQALRVSRQHRMLARSVIAERMFGEDEVLVAAHQLCALPGVYVDQSAEQVTYVHLLFDKHQVIYANGAPTESLFPGTEAQRSLPAEAVEELRLIFPALVDDMSVLSSARLIPAGTRQRQLIARHAKNAKPLLA